MDATPVSPIQTRSAISSVFHAGSTPKNWFFSFHLSSSFRPNFKASYISIGKKGEKTGSCRKLVPCRHAGKPWHLFLNGNQEKSFSRQPVDIVILSNGPGEVSTWVRPVVRSLREHFQDSVYDIRISVVLTPCPHASGGELELVKRFEEVDRCLEPERFWQFLLFGKTKEWNWHKKGICIFLGGDQFYTVAIGKMLGYKTIAYAECSVRWPGLMDMYLLRSNYLLQGLPKWARRKCKIVGDLFLDAIASPDSTCSVYNTVQDTNNQGTLVPLVGLLPGSKAAKLCIGVPYFISVAEDLFQRMDGNVRFLLPMASTVSLEMLAKFADSNCNPFISRFNWGCGVVQQPKVLNGKLAAKEQCKGMLVTHNGVQIEILQQFPPYHLYKQCTLCLTTVGANTAELGNLAIPMIVVVPTFALDAFKGAAGGMLGMMTNIPGWLGNMVARMVNASVVHSIDYFAWPNRWAGKKVVPELIGEIEPEEVAIVAASYLMEDTHLDGMREQLQELAKKHCNIGHEMVLLSSPGASKSVAIATEELLV